MMSSQQQEPPQNSPQQSQWGTKKTRPWFLGTATLLVGLLLVCAVVYYIYTHSFSFIIDILPITIISLLWNAFVILVISVVLVYRTRLVPILMGTGLYLWEMIKKLPVWRINLIEDEESIEDNVLPILDGLPDPSTPPPAQDEFEIPVPVAVISGHLSPPLPLDLPTPEALSRNDQRSGQTIPIIQDVPPSTPPLVSLALTPAKESVFFPQTPRLPHIKDFYGRESDFITLKININSSTSTYIEGGSKVGKTWLVDYLQMSIKGTQDNKGNLYHVGYLDLSMLSCRTETDFVATVLQALDYSVQDVSPTELRLVHLEYAIRKLKERTPSVIPIICLDNFEGFSINEREKEFGLEFFRGLKALANLGLIFIITSKDSINKNKNVGEFRGSFTLPMKLKNFSVKEAEDFVEKKSLEANFTDDTKRNILQRISNPKNNHYRKPNNLQQLCRNGELGKL